jgi:cytochrome c biogenesis protein ResB
MLAAVHVFTALILAAILTGVMTLVFRRHRHLRDVVVFFFVIFLAAWGGGLWLKPAGPSLYGVYWFPFLVVALIVSLILITFIPRQPPHSTSEAKDQIERRRALERVFSVFVAILIAVLVLAVVSGYMVA